MIDIHSHILPGIDDGARDIYESLEMAEMAVRSGINVMVATPHCNIPGAYDNYFGNEYIQVYNQVSKAIADEKIPLRLLPGMEAFATYNLPDLLVDKKIMPLNQSRYVLIEFAFDEDPMFANDVLKRVREIGARPVIAHAERYQFVQDNPQIVYEWNKKGYAVQLNKGSYEGKFGKTTQAVSNILLEHNLVSVVASDAHRIDIRKPYMREAYDCIEREFSAEMANRLFVDNARKICRNIPVWNEEAVSF